MSAGHDHAPANFDRAFGIGIALNIAFVAIEAFSGWKIDSLACWPTPATTSAT